MGLGFRLSSICLAFVLASGLFVLPDEAHWEALIPEPPAQVTPLPPFFAPGADMDDVVPADWFYGYIRRGVRQGFLRGADGRFEPQRAVTRSEFITMLGRTHTALGGVIDYDWGPEAAFLLYIDIVPGADYIPYLTWATELGIVRGDAQQRFRPAEPLNREMLAVILARYVEVYAVYNHLVDRYADRGQYADWEQIAGWAYEAVHMLRSYDIMQGSRGGQNEPGGDDFRPKDQALRLEAAVILVRLFDAVFDARVAV